MSNFAKINPINLGDNRNVFLPQSKALATEVYAACATNGKATASYGVYFEMTERDDKYLVVVQNANASAAKKVTLKAGNDKIFGSGNDLECNIAAGSVNFIKIDSGRFKNVTNNATLSDLANIETTKDCVVIVGESTDIKVAVVKMPA